MPPPIGNSGRVTLTGLQLPSLAPNPAHFLATESGTSPADPRQAADRHCQVRTYLPPQAAVRRPRPPHPQRVRDDHDPTGPPSPVTRTVTGSCSRPPSPRRPPALCMPMHLLYSKCLSVWGGDLDTNTCAPRAARAMAVALPMPLVEPVINAVLPARSVMLLLGSFLILWTVPDFARPAAL